MSGPINAVRAPTIVRERTSRSEAVGAGPEFGGGRRVADQQALGVGRSRRDREAERRTDGDDAHDREGGADEHGRPLPSGRYGR
jgi:hypothetical protein